MCNKLLHWGFNWRIRETISKVNRIMMMPDCSSQAAQKVEKFPRIFHSPLGVRKTVKSSTAAVVAGSLHPDEKPLSAELRWYHCLGVDVALLQLRLDVSDLDPLPLITNNLME